MPKLTRQNAGKWIVGRQKPFIVPHDPNMSWNNIHRSDALWQFLIRGSLFTGQGEDPYSNPLNYFFTKAMAVMKENMKQCNLWPAMKADYEAIEMLVRTQRWHSTALYMRRMYLIMNDQIQQGKVPHLIHDTEFTGDWSVERIECQETLSEEEIEDDET